MRTFLSFAGTTWITAVDYGTNREAANDNFFWIDARNAYLQHRILFINLYRILCKGQISKFNLDQKMVEERTFYNAENIY